MTHVRNFSEFDKSSIHQPFFPADVREGDLIFANVRSLDPNIKYNKQLRVWKMSPLGIELLTDSKNEIPKGILIELNVRIGTQETIFQGLAVDNITDHQDKNILHIRLVLKSSEKRNDQDRRHATRWLCSNQFVPTAVAANPVKYNDFIYFRIKDISSSGFKIYTSLRNKFIVPGMYFDCIVNFPMITQINMKLKVKNVRIESENEKDVLAIGVTYDHTNRDHSEAVGQYLLQFSSVSTFTELIEQGFLVSNVSESVSFSFVKTKEDYDKVLELRYKAYLSANKLDKSKKPQDMADSLDAKSRIVIGKFKGEIVCSSRMIFHQYEDKLEQELYIKWPEHLPRRDELVEVTRACTDPDFRGSDLLMSLFRHMAVITAQSKKQWVLVCASDEMKKFYNKLGFEDTGLSYEHKVLNNLRHHVLIANLAETMTGFNVNPIYWNIVWSDATKYLAQYEYLHLDPISQIRISLYKLVKPIAFFIFKNKTYKKQKKYTKKEM